jgi:hybrid polyketide synthase / nonribosomal peptide synthetase ACE1
MPDLARAVEAVGQRHEALRTCFFVDENEQAVQGLLETATLYLEQKQITSEKDLASETKQMLNHVFDLERGESMKIALLSLSSSSHLLLISYHHINMDGISLQVLLSDLQKAYTRQPFSENMVQFPDFTARQTREIEDGKLDKELDFWRKEYPDIPPALPLFPMSRVNNRSMLKNYSLNTVVVRLPTTLATQIRKASREARTTTFHFYLAVMKTLLHRFLVRISRSNRSCTLSNSGDVYEFYS